MSDELGPLFDFRPTPPRATEQDRELERVGSRIRGAIVEFCRGRLGVAWRADELRAHVEAKCGPTAPGSADRILRQLRQEGVIAYRVLSRKNSLYVVEGA